ncbi:hypothetical protein L3N51_01923 [Metallosphaera sp. J1]|uniref:hypothetical protein n=1 Tax=Metallosphaera javensis (ex Hofmann et al. 2022) TaxID=99938 RepID=UPI001EDF8EE2|nr:hypothetical protein [Metallosphaera javensis (ex Hofmann et al. 2022)]MCG3109628.1 hypothetical protein [Metallosphaera javensis (ex Hofmann et al. 2022)]
MERPSSHKIFLARLLHRLYLEGEVKKDVIAGRPNKHLDDLIKSLAQLGVIEIRDEKIVKGKAYELGSEVLFTYTVHKVSMSEKGDRSYRTKKEFVSLVPISTRYHAIHRYHYTKSPKVLRLGKVKIVNYIHERRVTGRWEIVERSQNVELRINFDPPLEPGEFVSYGYSTWDGRYYGTTVEELRRKYNIDFSSEGVAVTSPTLYVKLSVSLPWKPRSVDAYTTMRKPDNTLVFSKIDQDHVFRGDLNMFTLEMKNPGMNMYSIRWTPPH